jgi:large subunit ribosomal protein L18Ae
MSPAPVWWLDPRLLTRTQILRVVEIEKTEDVKRPYIKQLLTKNLTFPLPHRVPRIANSKIFSAKRPSTFA